MVLRYCPDEASLSVLKPSSGVDRVNASLPMVCLCMSPAWPGGLQWKEID